MNRFRRASWYKFGIPKTLVIAKIAQKLSCILEKVLQLVIINVSFLGQMSPVTFAMLVQGDDEIVNGLGLWRYLTENDTSA